MHIIEIPILKKRVIKDSDDGYKKVLEEIGVSTNEDDYELGVAYVMLDSIVTIVPADKNICEIFMIGSFVITAAVSATSLIETIKSLNDD